MPYNSERKEKRLAIREAHEIIERAMLDDENARKESIFARNEDFLALKTLLGLDERFTPRMSRFLVAYAQNGTVLRASQAAKISTSSHYGWLREYDWYRAAFEEAQKINNDFLENLALELSSGVYTKPVVSAGRLVCYERIFDTKLLARVMAARNPQKYGNKVDITSNGHSLVKLVDKDSWDAI